MDTRVHLLLLLAASPAQADDTAKMIYENTAELPDGYAFNYLSLSISQEFEAGEANGVHFIQDMLNLPHNDAGKKLAAEFASPLVHGRPKMKRAERQVEFDLLCDPIAETEEDAFRGLERLDEARLLVYEKHLLLTKRKMSSENARALEALVHKTKLSSSIVVTDHRAAYAKHSIDPVEMVHKICAYVEGELQ